MAKEFPVFLLQKLSLSSEKYGFGIRDPEKSIPDPGSRGQKGTGSGSATLVFRSLLHFFLYLLDAAAAVATADTVDVTIAAATTDACAATAAVAASTAAAAGAKTTLHVKL